MSMDQSAIKQITDNAIAASKVSDKTNIPTVAIPDNMSVVSLEKYMDSPSRFRGIYSTDSLPDFASYTKENAPCKCFVDASTMSVSSIFDLGSIDAPGHGEHSATLTLQDTAPYTAMLNMNGRKNGQRAMADWLEDWRNYLTAENQDGEEVDIKKAVAAIRRITIEASRNSEHEDKTMGASRSTLESVEAKSEHGLPAGFTFSCKPCKDLKQRDFYMQLSILTTDEPQLVLRISQLENLKEEIVEEFKELVIQKVDSDEVDTYIGEFTKRH